MSSWSKLAEAATTGTPVAPFVRTLHFLSEAVNETSDGIKDLTENPITAGKGFLWRADHEPAGKRENIVKAQDEFTRLLEFKKKPMLAAKAAYFLAITHVLLENDQELKRMYCARAALGIMDAIEECERERHSFNPATFFTEYANLYRNRVASKYDIAYSGVYCKSLQNGYVEYPRKDEFILGVESTVGVSIPICCIDFIDDLCDVHRLPEDYVAAHGKWRRFSTLSEYVKRKKAASHELERIARLK
jgi:hypothetical protein